jgi:hypothetical protein
MQKIYCTSDPSNGFPTRSGIYAVMVIQNRK